MADKLSPDCPLLMESHLAHLLESAISMDVIRERGYQSVLGKEPLKNAGFGTAQRRPTGILIPLWAPGGSAAGHQYRPDDPRTSARGKKIKYETPANAGIRIDMPPCCRELAGDPERALWITEGIKKVDSLASAGVCAIGLVGVWGFKGKNQWGGTTLLADWDDITLKDRRCYIAYDSDITTKPGVRRALERLAEHLKRKGASAHIVQLPQGDDQSKCGVDDYLAQGHTIAELESLVVEAPEDIEAEPIALHTPLYCIHDGQFCVIKNIEGRRMKSPLCNFTASITEEVILDDGSQQSRYFSIEGELCNGRNLPAIDVPVTDFNGMGWVTGQWGGGALVCPGSSTKDHLRYMIQRSIAHIQEDPRRIYTHMGWREINGERVFLSASGGIGRDDIEVKIRERLGQYALPQDLDPVSAVDAMKSSLSFMEEGLGSPRVMVPLWAGMYLSPLCEILDPAFTLFLHGHTGSFKSVLSALALCHFGKFTHLTMPTSWEYTANRIEYEMFVCKDLPLAVDDWAPGATIAAQREMENKIAIVLRAQGNRIGRGRLNADASPKDSYTPRGFLITSGEQLPSGESNTARMFVLDLEPGDVDIDALTIAQEDAVNYSYAMAHYLLWLAPQWSQLVAELPARWREKRDQAMAEGLHLRLPAAVAWLHIGLEMGMRFAEHVKAISHAEAESSLQQGWELLLSLAARQGARVDEERPANRFIEAIQTLMSQERLFLIDKQYRGPSDVLDQVTMKPYVVKPNESFVGWLDDSFYYLIPRAIYAVVSEFYSRSGTPMTFKPPAIWSDLRRLGMSECDENRNDTRAWVGSGRSGGQTVRIVKLRRSAVVVT